VFLNLQLKVINMGSMAQDARHERIFQDAKDKVYHLKKEVDEKQDELAELTSKLSDAERHLDQMIEIDYRRD
jgi:hypothetical protein